MPLRFHGFPPANGDGRDIAVRGHGVATGESGKQRRMRAPHSSNAGRRSLEIHPSLRAGVGLVRGRAGTSLAGRDEEVASLIEECASAGITECILSGHPHLDGAYWFGEGVQPLREKRRLWRHPASSREVKQTFSPTRVGPPSREKMTAS